MSHFAKVLDGKVVQVIVAEPEFFSIFVDSSPGTWIQTSYNTHGGVHYGPDGQPDGGTPLRMNFASVGGVYDPKRDAFIPPQPFPSWNFVEATCLWDPPMPYPTDGKGYVWNEDAQSWVEVTE